MSLRSVLQNVCLVEGVCCHESWNFCRRLWVFVHWRVGLVTQSKWRKHVAANGLMCGFQAALSLPKYRERS